MGDQRKLVGCYSLSVPWHFGNRMECPSGKIKQKNFRVCQVRQSSLAAHVTVLVRTRTFLLLLNCHEAGIGSITNEFPSTFLRAKIAVLLGVDISGDGRLLCKNVSAQMILGSGEGLELRVWGMENLFITLV